MPDQHLLHTKGIRESLYENGRHCGTKITVFDASGTKPLVVTVMDAFNRITERLFHADGMTLAQRHAFLYSLDGRLRRKQIFDAGDRLAESIFFDGSGQVIKAERFTHDAMSGRLTMVETYNASGLIRQKESHDGDGRLIRTIYDDDGEAVETTWRDYRGILMKKIVRCRDGESGTLEFDYLRDGGLLEARCYDADRRLMQVDNYHATGQLTRNAYNEEGQLAEISYLDAGQRLTRRVLLQYDSWGICIGKQDLHSPGDGHLAGISGYDMGRLAQDGTCDDVGIPSHDDMREPCARPVAPDGDESEDLPARQPYSDDTLPPPRHALRRARTESLESVDIRITEKQLDGCADRSQQRNVADIAPLVTERLFHDARGRLMQREQWRGKRRIAHREIFFYRHDAYIGKKIIVYRYAGLLGWLGTDKLARRHAVIDVYDADGNLLLHTDRYWLVW